MRYAARAAAITSTTFLCECDSRGGRLRLDSVLNRWDLSLHITVHRPVLEVHPASCPICTGGSKYSRSIMLRTRLHLVPICNDESYLFWFSMLNVYGLLVLRIVVL